MITLKHAVTGETRLIESGTIFRAPWQVDTSAIIANAQLRRQEYVDKYPYKKCSTCGGMGVFEGT